MKIQAYFSRKVPFYLLDTSELNDELAFDAYPVTTDSKLLDAAQKLRSIVRQMKEVFEEGSAPEDCAQKEADTFAELFASLKGKTNGS